MGAELLNGRAIASSIRKEITEKFDKLRQERGVVPGLVVLLVGDDPASALYVRLKKQDCDETGVECTVKTIASEVQTDQLIDLIEQLNQDTKVHGILLQLPLPEHIDAARVIEHIEPLKDVDGITPYNLGRLVLRDPSHRCCTPRGVMTLLQHTGVDLLGKHAVILGASNHVGRPMCLELLMVGCTVTVCHRFTPNSQIHAQQADILVSATGKAGLVSEEWIKPGAIVIDVGISAQADGKIRGDVKFAEVRKVASWITPVPGGVGPMTRVSILQNVLDAFQSTPT